ncbi:type II toxin-antitoxin system VapC family toxin [Agromyces sp. NPDC058484]|uniref:type II toxin-antitoxin system VapC family toxin n=1 Tax=Agromyces sp. NPDC058484 TaxID=3346524 RepID=UPI00364774BD
MIVLDTNVLSEPMREAPSVAVLDWFRSVDEPTAVTAISVGELLDGAMRLSDGRRRAELIAAIEHAFDAHRGIVLPYDERAARACARLQAVRRAAGRPLSVEDGMIAAICVSTGARLATRNTLDFEGLGIELVNPWQTGTFG